MGADEFLVKQTAISAKRAFILAVEDARDEYGHRGYTGTIAEKSSFRMIVPPNEEGSEEYANSLLELDDHWVCNKWGPAGCILLEEHEDGTNMYLFFGLASS
jgi:hypothetical protein